jgi:hypothetical protein
MRDGSSPRMMHDPEKALISEKRKPSLEAVDDTFEQKAMKMAGCFVGLQAS